jgi:hypothetical protein
MPPVQAAAEQTATVPALPDKTSEEGEPMADHTTPGKVEAAKKKMAVALDGPGILTTLREAYAIPAAIDDAMFAALVAQALAGKAIDTDEMMEAPEAEATTPPAGEASSDDAAGCGPKKPFGASRITLDEKAEADQTERIIAAVQKAAKLGRITPATLDAAGALARADVAAFEAIFCAPVPPPAGRLITATASDRGPKTGETFADRVRAARFAAMRQ